MYKIAVLGDRESVMGFKALGLDVITAETVEQARRDLHEMARDPEYAIIYLTEQLAAQMPDEVDKYKDRLTPAVILIPGKAGSLGIGMEIEFEPTLLNAREGSGTFRKRLRDYIDYAKRRNIYGKRPFAYYHGTNGFYDLHASDDEADRELFDELCQFIINNPLRAQRPTTDRK